MVCLVRIKDIIKDIMFSTLSPVLFEVRSLNIALLVESAQISQDSTRARSEISLVYGPQYHTVSHSAMWNKNSLETYSATLIRCLKNDNCLK